MNRRQALLTTLGAAVTLGVPATSEGEDAGRDAAPIPGAVPIRMGQATALKVLSNSIQYKGQTFSLLAIERATFEIDGNSRLTAKLYASILQWARIDYWVSVAVFDAAGRLLGTASHKEEVKRIQLGRTVMVQRDIALDFGISKAFANAVRIVVAISERDVPTPDNSGNVGK